MKWVGTIIAFLILQVCVSQTPADVLKELKDNSDQQVLTRTALNERLNKLDTTSLIRLMNEVKQSTEKSSQTIRTRALALKARLFFYQLGPGDSVYTALMKDALYSAYELDESFMIAEYSRWYSEMLNSLGKRHEAVQYALNSIVMQEQLGINNFPTINTFYFTIGELFFRTRNREDAVTWLKKGLNLPGRDSVQPVNYANGINNLALAYYQLHLYPEALAMHGQCMLYAKQHHLDDWYELSYFNRINPLTELGYYDSCYSILDKLYQQAKDQNNEYMLAGACFSYGQVANREKNYPRALEWLTQAEEHTAKLGVRGYYMKIMKELSTCYDGLHQYDKSLKYYKEWKYLADSAAKHDASERSDYLMTKANFEKQQVDFRKLKKTRNSDIRLRNVGIGALALLSGLVIWWLNRKRKKARRDQEEAEKQLQLFTKNIISKDQEIDALRYELHLQSNNSEKVARVEELSQQMILTEDDWQRFQSLFNKSYPGFLQNLKDKFAGITEAETRMACLIKLHLNTKQIASMLGISPDSVHKTRHRLRQRFATSSTAELEAIIATV